MHRKREQVVQEYGFRHLDPKVPKFPTLIEAYKLYLTIF